MNQKSKTKQFVAGLIGASLALSLAFAVTVKADTVSDLTAQINSLLATITSLQTKLAAIQGGSTGGGSYTFSSDLSLGSSGADVMNLQKVLNMSTDTQVASGGSAGAPGYETSKFGPATKAAVIKFQKKNGVPGTGYVGPMTRAKLNSMSTQTTTTTTTTTPTTTTTTTTTTNPVVPAGTGLTVSSPVQPAVTIAPYKASRVPFTKVTLTAGSDGDVTINSLTVQRTGLANDSAFSSIVLLDENGLQIGTSKTFNSNHQTTLGEPFVVPRGTSRTLTVAGNMETSVNTLGGQVASLTVVGVNTSATVTGALPITGAAQTINETLTLGTATLYVSQYDPSSALSKNIGDTGLKFSGIKVTAGSSEDVTLWSIRWNQTGSAGSTDITNVKTVLDGTSYPTVVSADGKYYTSLFPNGIVIQKGFSKDMYITGDIVGSGSASRTVEFDIYDSSDLYLSGNTYNFGILGAANSSVAPSALTATSRSKFTTGSPFYAGSIVTINAGTVTTVAKSTTVAPAANIAVNVPNQILGAYDTNIKGEPVSVQSTVFHISSNSSVTTDLLKSVSLIDKNGSVVAGPIDAKGVNAGTSGIDGSPGAAGDQTVTFTDTITYPVGVGTYTLVGKIPSTYSNGSTIIASTTPSGWGTVKGQITGNTLTLSNAVFGMNTMTVRTAALNVGASTQPAAQTVVAGSQDFTFTNMQFDATQSGEDVRISTVPTTLTFSAGSASDISSCRLYDGATNLTTGSNVINPASGDAAATAHTFTLDQALIIPKGTVKTISVKCNVSSSATAFVGHWDMTAAQVTSATTFVVTGVTSTQSVTATGSAIGAGMTVGSASLTVTGDTSNTSYKIASAGTQGVIVGAYRFKATNDNINLQRVALQLTNTASSSSQDLTLVHLFQGTTEVGSATFTGSSYFATSTFANPVLLTRGTDTVLTAKVDLAAIGGDATTPIPSGHLINVDINANDTTGTYGTGIGSGARVNASGSTSIGSTGIRVFKSYPTIAQNSMSSAGLSASSPLLRFMVSADSKGPINIYKFLINFSTSSATVNSFNVYAFSDSAYSQPIAGLSSGGQMMQSNITVNGTVGSTISPNVAVYAQTNTGASTTIQVTPTNPVYFEVRPSSITLGTSPYSVVTTLKGDTAYPGVTNTLFMASTTGIDSLGNSSLNSFIWSPNSTTTAPLVSDVDWTNGYALPGLPANGISQSRSN